jgi:FkbM family methyltransferase
LFHRKLQSLLTVVRRCENWPAIVAAKMGLHPNLREVRLKDGLRLRADQGALAAWGEIFEPAVADAYGVADFPADLIVDVGANIGAFSCRASRSHPGAPVYAFEPNPDAARQARANFALNGIENVHFIESAATQDGRDVVLHLNPSPGGVSIVLMGEGPKVAMRSVTLDVVPFQKASSVFIKMDCEGAEAELVAWIVNHLELLPPRVLISGECHAWCPQPADQMIATSRQAGFQAELIPKFGATYFRAERSLRA